MTLVIISCGSIGYVIHAVLYGNYADSSTLWANSSPLVVAKAGFVFGFVLELCSLGIEEWTDRPRQKVANGELVTPILTVIVLSGLALITHLIPSQIAMGFSVIGEFSPETVRQLAIPIFSTLIGGRLVLIAYLGYWPAAGYE